MKNIVYTYYDHVPKIDYRQEHELINLWKISWTRYGWTPVVLEKKYIARPENVRIAREYKFPQFESYERNISRFPSVCPQGYDMACFLRWYAIALAAASADITRNGSRNSGSDFKINTLLPVLNKGALLTTYACMNYGFTPKCLETLVNDNATALENKFLMIFTCIPCAMFGFPNAFRKTLEYFADLPVQDALRLTNSIYKCNFINDMLAIRLPYAIENLWIHRSIARPHQVQARDLGDPDYKNALLVHFSNYGKSIYKFKTKTYAIHHLRPVVLTPPAPPKVRAPARPQRPPRPTRPLQKRRRILTSRPTSLMMRLRRIVHFRLRGRKRLVKSK